MFRQPDYLSKRDPWLSVPASQQVWLFPMVGLYDKNITPILPIYKEENFIIL